MSAQPQRKPQPNLLQHLPLDRWHRDHGARMVPFAGYEMPVQYEGIIAEHEWTRSQASLFDVSHMGQVFIGGDGVEAALEKLLPIDLKTLAKCRLRYSLLLNGKGGVVDDLIVARWALGFYIVVNGATKHTDIAFMEERLPEGVIVQHMDNRALFALQGPQAFAVLERLVSGEKPLASLTFMSGGLFNIGDSPSWISRTGYSGEDGFEIACPAEKAEMIADLILGEPEVKLAGLGARDSLRLEAGLPLYGHELSLDTDPVSAGLGFAIAKRRRATGGFPGADRIVKLLAEGTPRTLVGIALDGRMAAREDAPVFAGDTQVGVVTSGGFSPTLGHAIAMAYVGPEHAEPGTQLEAEVRGKRLTGHVVPLPFVPHRYHR